LFDEIQLNRVFLSAEPSVHTLRLTAADPADEFHDFPVDQVLGKALRVCLFLADHNDIGLKRNNVLIESEAFPDKSFYPVAFYRVTDFSGSRNPHSPSGKVIGPDKNNETGGKITTAPGITFLKKGPFVDPQVFAEF
jgi:hypothetical protein